MRIEMLYPEVANLHGDQFNVTYLTKCRPDATVVTTALTDTPAFVDSAVDLIYLGPMAESGQLRVVERLRPYTQRISELIDKGTVFLFTHNAMEVLGERIWSISQDYDIPGLGILPLTSRIDLLGRYNGKVMGEVSGSTIVGYKSQFSSVEVTSDIPPFLTADRGVGRNIHTPLEGVRINNFIGTSLIGPLLLMNPDFTTYLLTLLDPDTEPTLAFPDIIRAAYDARLADFHDPLRWHPAEDVQP